MQPKHSTPRRLKLGFLGVFACLHLGCAGALEARIRAAEEERLEAMRSSARHTDPRHTEDSLAERPRDIE